MKFDRQLRPATETSWVVSYGGKTIPRWRTAAILKIVISPYLSEKSSDFHEIIYTATDFELDERHVIKNEIVALLDRLRVRQNVYLVHFKIIVIIPNLFSCQKTRPRLSKYGLRVRQNVYLVHFKIIVIIPNLFSCQKTRPRLSKYGLRVLETWVLVSCLL